MNQTIQQLIERKSVRVFTEQEITAQEKALILDAAAQAPTAGNQQLYTILDITDSEMKQKLSVSCDNQPFIATAPMVLIFCADYRRWYDVFCRNVEEVRTPSMGDLFLAEADAIIAADTPGLFPADPRKLTYRHLRRPIFPLDEDTVFEA